MENNTGVVIIGFLALVCLIAFALILKNGQSVVPVVPQAAPPAQQMPAQPPKAEPDHHHCPPPVCPQDILLYKQMYDMGYLDAACGRKPNAIYRHDPSYMRGYRDGSPFCPPNLRFNIIID